MLQEIVLVTACLRTVEASKSRKGSTLVVLVSLQMTEVNVRFATSVARVAPVFVCLDSRRSATRRNRRLAINLKQRVWIKELSSWLYVHWKKKFQIYLGRIFRWFLLGFHALYVFSYFFFYFVTRKWVILFAWFVFYFLFFIHFTCLLWIGLCMNLMKQCWTIILLLLYNLYQGNKKNHFNKMFFF